MLMKNKLATLVNPVFLFSLVILLLNDIFLKYQFPNFLTGKLSDFAGLFAFSFFLFAFFPKHKKIVSLLIIAFFIFWKSPLSQGMIGIWNDLQIYHIGRAIDFSDLMALPMVFLADRYIRKEISVSALRRFSIPIALIAVFSFCSTSYLHVYTIDKSFVVPLSKEDVVRRINEISSRCDNFIPLSANTENADTTFVDYDSDTVSYSVTGYRYYNDTMWLYDKQGKKTGIDTVRIYKYFDRDTMYLSPTGFFIMCFDVKEYLQLPPEQYCGCIKARCRLKQNGENSVLTIHTADAAACGNIKPGDKGSKQLMEAFKQLVINKMLPLEF